VKLTNEELVNLRKGLVILLEDDCGYNNYDVLNREKLTARLTFIANTDGFEVDTHCTEQFWEFRKYSNSPHIKISDDKNFILRVIRIATNGGGWIYRVLYDEYDLMTDTERYAIDREETMAEETMNNWANGFS
jgi:hypothetical protein